MATAVEGRAAGAVSSGDFGSDCNGEDSNGEGARELATLLLATAGDSAFLQAAKPSVSTPNTNPDNTNLKFTIIAPTRLQKMTRAIRVVTRISDREVYSRIALNPPLIHC